MGPHLASTTRNQCRCGCNAESADINSGAAHATIIPARRQVNDGHGGGSREPHMLRRWRTAAALDVESPMGCTTDVRKANG